MDSSYDLRNFKQNTIELWIIKLKFCFMLQGYRNFLLSAFLYVTRKTKVVTVCAKKPILFAVKLWDAFPREINEELHLSHRSGSICWRIAIVMVVVSGCSVNIQDFILAFSFPSWKSTLAMSDVLHACTHVWLFCAYQVIVPFHVLATCLVPHHAFETFPVPL